MSCIFGTARALILGLFGSCHLLAAAAAPAGNQVVYLPSTAPGNSHLSRITSDHDGRVFVSWVSEKDSLASLAYSQLESDRWTEPRLISQGSDWFVNWADFPVLSVNDGNMAAHWLQKSSEGTYDYNIVARFYDQAQQQWSADTPVNTSGVNAEYGFVSMLPLVGSQTLITWLDGRNTRSQSAPAAMTLRAAVFDAAGKNQREWELDEAVCDCCQTSAAMTAQGPVVVYRDRSDEDVRDTSIVRFVDGNWTKPRTVHQDGWQIEGCPVNGPAVAAQQSAVAVAWFTARNESPKVQLALSSDSGETFSQPILVAGPDTNGRIDAVILQSGETVVSWLNTADGEATIMLSRFGPSGNFIDRTQVAKTSASRRSGFPVMDHVANAVYVSWTDVSGPAEVRVARVNFE
ncbi:MAG: hypothetical protein NWP69_14760 [Congregibacter sp.]|nr:hypothetical protein [Congregibacter sp.]